ncbi:MAG: hybrid sensor histidine kinase/response regulator [Flavisolibacter sp.]|jgi:hypothetical protein|nr:hybrid sensor histidine kinase/response regulator [Flavisolibacter sp.]
MSAPHLVNFKVFDQPKLFNKSYYELTDVELKYNEIFSPLIFPLLIYQTAGLQYAYRLEGFDKDWRVIDKTSASYTNVPPGRYKLLLRTQYGLGKWKEAAPISIRILAPFWLSWWAISLFAIGGRLQLLFYLPFPAKT